MKIFLIIILLIFSCHPIEQTTRFKHYRQKIVEKPEVEVGEKDQKTETSKEPVTDKVQKLSVGYNNTKHSTLDLFIKKWLGVPYRYGGNNENGIDCSALSSTFYQEMFNRELERTAELQYSQGQFVKKNYLQEGDLVFFDLDSDKFTIDHVGIFLSDGKFIHASTSQGVTISELSDSYYSDNYIGARRIN
jgi:cell wall-associated NlpC family hydrolase